MSSLTAREKLQQFVRFAIFNLNCFSRFSQLFALVTKRTCACWVLHKVLFTSSSAVLKFRQIVGNGGLNVKISKFRRQRAQVANRKKHTRNLMARLIKHNQHSQLRSLIARRRLTLGLCKQTAAMSGAGQSSGKHSLATGARAAGGCTGCAGLRALVAY